MVRLDKQRELDKGFIKPVQRVISGEHTYDHKKRIREGFIVPEVKRALDTLKRFPDKFRPSVRKKVVRIVSSWKPK